MSDQQPAEHPVPRPEPEDARTRPLPPRPEASEPEPAAEPAAPAAESASPPPADTAASAQPPPPAAGSGQPGPPPPGYAYPPGQYPPPGSAASPPRWWRRTGRSGWARPLSYLAVGLVGLLLGCVLGAGVMAVVDRHTGDDGFRGDGRGHYWRDGQGRPPAPPDGPYRR
jgi:hypothetical protein